MKYALALTLSLLASGYATASALDLPDAPAIVVPEDQAAQPAPRSAALNPIPVLLIEGDDHKISFREQNEVPARIFPVEEIQMIASHNAEGGLATTIVIDASNVIQQAYLHKPAVSNQVRRTGMDQQPNPDHERAQGKVNAPQRAFTSTPLFVNEPHAVATEVVKASGYLVAYLIDSARDSARSVRIPINQVSTRVYVPEAGQPYTANTARVSLPQVSVEQIVQQAAAAPVMTLAEMADQLTASRELAAQAATASEHRAAQTTANTLARLAELAPAGTVDIAPDNDEQPEGESTIDADDDAQANADAHAQVETDADVEPRVDADADAEPEPDAESDADKEADADTNAEHEAPAN